MRRLLPTATLLLATLAAAPACAWEYPHRHGYYAAPPAWHHRPPPPHWHRPPPPPRPAWGWRGPERPYWAAPRYPHHEHAWREGRRW